MTLPLTLLIGPPQSFPERHYWLWRREAKGRKSLFQTYVRNQVIRLLPGAVWNQAQFEGCTLIADSNTTATLRDIQLKNCHCFYDGILVEVPEWLALIVSKQKGISYDFRQRGLPKPPKPRA